MQQRFDHEAETIGGAIDYLKNRGKQLLIEGYQMQMLRPWNDAIGQTIGVLATFKGPGGYLASFYLLNQFRGKQLYKKLCRETGYPIITVPDCQIDEYLKINDIPHKVVGEPLMWKEYKAVEYFYADTQAKRSGLFWMNHIDEGLTLLRRNNAGESAMRAFCLHPLVQRDEDLARNYNLLHRMGMVEPLMLAMEYRNIANAFLSPMSKHPGYKDWHKIKLSPLPEVNAMLVADKIQNRKDFLAHKDKYPNRDALDNYFKQWLCRLEVSEEAYQEHVRYLRNEGKENE